MALNGNDEALFSVLRSPRNGIDEALFSVLRSLRNGVTRRPILRPMMAAKQNTIILNDCLIMS